MGNIYNESEKIWHATNLELKYPNLGIGQVILTKLKESDQKRVIEVEHESGNSITAEELRCQTITVAQNLIRLGVKKGDVVIVFSRSSIKITPITFALYTIGAPVSFFYLDLEGDDVKHYFEKLDPTVILYEEEFKNKVVLALESLKLPKLQHLISLDSKTDSVDEVLFQSTADDIENFQPPDVGNPMEALAVLAFTTGSTGKPKITKHSHAMLLIGIHHNLWHMEAKGIVCVLSDLRWMCQTHMMLQPVFFDVKRIYTSKCEKYFDDTYEYELLYKHKVTHFFTVPILLLHTLQNANNSNSAYKLGYLKTVPAGGEVVTASLIKYAAKVTPNCRIISCYGMTELFGFIASEEEVIGKRVNGGLLQNGYSAKIIDAAGNSLGPNEKGRLCLKSLVPLPGYLKNDEANEEHFKEVGWYTTNEYAYMDSDHLLNVITRFEYLLRLNGKLVIPTQIENIINAHPNVLISALVGFPNPNDASSDIGTIFVSLQNNDASDGIEDELISLLKQNLTDEQSKLVRFLKVVDKMPMCNYIKVNRILLKKIAANESETYLKLN